MILNVFFFKLYLENIIKHQMFILHDFVGKNNNAVR